MSNMDFKNARDPEQIRRMKALQKAGLCYFCREGSEEEVTVPQAIHSGDYWYVTPNNFPLEGSVHHYMIVPMRHIKDLSEITKTEAVELYRNMVPWLKRRLGVTGYSMFVRSGDTRFTGATIEHLHFHFLVGGEKPEPCTLDDVVPVVVAFKER